MIVRERNQPGRTAVARRQMAMSILATAFMTACGGGQSPTQSAASAIPPASSAASSAVDPASSASQPSLPGGRLVYIALNEGNPRVVDRNSIVSS